MSKKKSMPISSKPHWDKAILHPAYSEILLHIAGLRGISADQLCEPDQLARLKLRHNPRWFAALLLKILRENPAMSSIGFEFGEQMDLASAGIIGQAILSCPTLGVACDLACRYYPLTGLLLDFDRQRVGDDFIFTFEVGYENVPPQIKIMILESLLASWQGANKLLFGIDLQIKTLCFDYPEPTYVQLYHDYFNCDIHFNCHRTTMTIDASLIHHPTLTSNPVAHHRAVGHCEEALQRRCIVQTTTDQVRRLIKEMNKVSDANIEIVAGRLNLSSRSLNRRLRLEEVSYKTLVDEYRCQRACLLLANTDSSLEQIADQLGYSDPSNFRRAFKKWTGGTTPTDFRRRPLGSFGENG
jgi:AraC-like DNA-binding protein